jgi:hypothetical protein
MLAMVPMWLFRTVSAQRIFSVATIAYAVWLLYLFVLTPARSLSDPYRSVAVAVVIYVVAILVGTWLHFRSKRFDNREEIWFHLIGPRRRLRLSVSRTR